MQQTTPSDNTGEWTADQLRLAERLMRDLDRVGESLAPLRAARAAGATWAQNCAGWHLAKDGKIVWAPETKKPQR